MCAVALWCSAQAQRPALEFNGEGKFKIAQFTDDKRQDYFTFFQELQENEV